MKLSLKCFKRVNLALSDPRPIKEIIDEIMESIFNPKKNNQMKKFVFLICALCAITGCKLAKDVYVYTTDCGAYWKKSVSETVKVDINISKNCLKVYIVNTDVHTQGIKFTTTDSLSHLNIIFKYTVVNPKKLASFTYDSKENNANNFAEDITTAVVAYKLNEFIMDREHNIDVINESFKQFMKDTGIYVEVISCKITH